MSHLFKLKRAREDDTSKQSLLGFERITVLAIEPWALAKPVPAGFGAWALAAIRCMYVCEADGQLVRIGTGDLWHEIEAGIYELVREGT